MFSPRRTTKTIATAAALAAFAAVPAAAQAKTAGPKVIKVTASSKAKTRGASDAFNFAHTLRSNGKTVGSDTGSCTKSDPIYFTCDMTIRLNGGTIKVSVPSSDDATVVADIYNGTGAYKAATGTVTITGAINGTSQYRIAFS